MKTETVALKFQVGERTLFEVRRKLVRRVFSLNEVLSEQVPAFSPHPPDTQGSAIRSLPVGHVGFLRTAYAGDLIYEQQRYPRHFIRMDGDFDAYMGHFSGKSRSSLKRKLRKWEKFAGGIDVREYRNADEQEEFYRFARQVSEKTYQEKLLDAGLPEGEEALAEMHHLADADSIRSYLLFHNGAPVSYLYLPVDGACLIYNYLGYDPEYRRHSPGTVLQVVALERLFAENRFALFDFTEGDGQHKRSFGTDFVDCSDLLVLAPTLGNRVVLGALRGFDGTVGLLSRTAERLGIKARLRRLVRGTG